MQARGRICLRSDLLRDVWQASPAAGTNVVDVYVNYLRKKLSAARSSLYGDTFGPDRVIETVRGEGYLMPAASHTPLPAGIKEGIRKPVALAWSPSPEQALIA